MVTAQVMDKAARGTVDQADIDALAALLALENGARDPEPEEKIVHRGDGMNSAPMAHTKVRSAGYVYLRRNSDGKLVPVSKNQLLERMKQKLEDGRPPWLLPNVQHPGPFLGTEKCLLHPDHPDYIAKYKAMGFVPCGKKSAQPPKAHMANREAVLIHMKNKHKMAWQAIQGAEARAREDRRDAREERTAVALEAALGRKPDVAPEPHREQTVAACAICAKAFTGRKQGVRVALGRHMKKAHPPKEG